MLAKLKRLDEISKQSKYVIFGYIREHHRSFASDDYNIFNHIPDIVPSLCISYYHQTDTFRILGDKIAYRDNIKPSMIKAESSRYQTMSSSYSDVIIPSTTKCSCTWNLKMINITRHDRTCIKVGIASTKSGWKGTLGNEYYIHSNLGWCKTHHTTPRYDKMTKFVSGDIISIRLNLIDGYRYVSFHNSRTKVSQKLMVDGNDGDVQYRLAVGIHYTNIVVSIENYELCLYE